MSARFILLDSTPLGLLSHPQGSAIVRSITEWADGLISAKDRIIVPAITHYEVRRELLRAGKAQGLLRLEEFTKAVPGRYLPLTDNALQLAAQLWADSRMDGKPTSSPESLDVDVILSAQALTFGPSAADIVVATSNSRHLSRLSPALIGAKSNRDCQAGSVSRSCAPSKIFCVQSSPGTKPN